MDAVDFDARRFSPLLRFSYSMSFSAFTDLEQAGSASVDGTKASTGFRLRGIRMNGRRLRDR